MIYIYRYTYIHMIYTYIYIYILAAADEAERQRKRVGGDKFKGLSFPTIAASGTLVVVGLFRCRLGLF
jgi:hypothetical protein